MKSISEHLAPVVPWKWVLILAGGGGFVVFGVTGGMLADAGWQRINNVLAPLAILGWAVAAFGVGLHIYDLGRKKPN